MPGKMSDPGSMPEKIMKFGGDVGEDKEIRASSKKGRASTGKGWIRVSTGKGRNPTSVGKVESGKVPKKGSGEYREMVESE